MNAREWKRGFRLLIVCNNRFRRIGMHAISFASRSFTRTMQRVHLLCRWCNDSMMEFYRHTKTRNYHRISSFHCRRKRFDWTNLCHFQHHWRIYQRSIRIYRILCLQLYYKSSYLPNCLRKIKKKSQNFISFFRPNPMGKCLIEIVCDKCCHTFFIVSDQVTRAKKNATSEHEKLHIALMMMDR